MVASLTEQELALVTALRHALHAHPELSGHEQWTKATLMAFLRKHTSLAVVDRGSWFYAVKKADGHLPAIAFRADMDALPMEEGISLPWGSTIPGVAHKCGHDGHSAALCAFALLLDRLGIPQDTCLIFQPAEETGAGGAACAAFLQEAGISRCYGLHNWSGFPEGQVLTKPGLAMYASLGLTVSYRGIPAHASFPEDGKNPTMALCALAEAVEALAGPSVNDRPDGRLATIVGLSSGGANFGLAASEGRLCCTLRAGSDAALSSLKQAILKRAEALAATHGLTMESTVSDAFPAVVNDATLADAVEQAACEAGLSFAPLPAPFRTSEDFGHYTATVPSVMVFIGNGKNYPPIHTAEYDFVDTNLPRIASLFYAMAKSLPLS